MVGVVEVAPLYAAQEPRQFGFIQVEASAEAGSLDVVEVQHGQVVAVGLLSKLEHVELPVPVCVLQA